MQALIGHTGFVGTNLQRQTDFDLKYNSSNIGEIDGKSVDRIVCAGVSAVKWWANKNADEDWQRIRSLIERLKTVEAGHFTLISTVDVYGTPFDVTEDDASDRNTLHPYGLNRLRLEDFVMERFPSCSIVRLPALFGFGLKKNAIYDLIHGNMLEVINPASSFQWYPLRRLSQDLEVAERSNVKTINFATPPILMERIRSDFFPSQIIGEKAAPAAHYDFKTRFGGLFGRSDAYIMSQNDVVDELGRFLAEG